VGPFRTNARLSPWQLDQFDDRSVGVGETGDPGGWLAFPGHVGWRADQLDSVLCEFGQVGVEVRGSQGDTGQTEVVQVRLGGRVVSGVDPLEQVDEGGLPR